MATIDGNHIQTCPRLATGPGVVEIGNGLDMTSSGGGNHDKAVQ